MGLEDAVARHHTSETGQAFVDADGDGSDDTVAVTVDASLPILLPVRWSGYSPTHFTRTMRARIEVFQAEPA